MLAWAEFVQGDLFFVGQRKLSLNLIYVICPLRWDCWPASWEEENWFCVIDTFLSSPWRAHKRKGLKGENTENNQQSPWSHEVLNTEVGAGGGSGCVIVRIPLGYRKRLTPQVQGKLENGRNNKTRILTAMWWMKVWGYLEDRPAELSRKQLPIKKRSIWANVSLKTNMMVWVLVRHHSKLADIPQLVAQGEMSLIHYMLNPRPRCCWRYALPVELKDIGETGASCRIGKGLFSVILSCFNSK